MFYLLVAVKLILGFLTLVLVINLTDKGNLAPASASDQVQNYVLGGIVGGVIYNPDITILEFLHYEIGKRRVGKECRSRWSPYH